MKRRNTLFNTKRTICQLSHAERLACAQLANTVRYGGNPAHKKNPGDFGLTPPSGPRPGKSLCDDAQIFSKDEALTYLQRGLQKGLISKRSRAGWPQNIWAVADNGTPLEAQLESPESGTYHGYPMPPSDPLADEVVRRWRTADDDV